MADDNVGAPSAANVKQQSESSRGKQPMPPPPREQAQTTGSLRDNPNAIPPPMGDYRESHEVHSRASDAGSDVKGDSASEAGSTATENTSMSAGTLASGASTAFFSQQAHVFSLDDFSGHAIQTILEDGETEPPPDPETEDNDRGSVEGQSVRPGSVVSNIEQRLDEIEGFQGEGQGDGDERLNREERRRARAAAEEQDLLDDHVVALSKDPAAAEAQYMNLLQQMQHRDLTPADLQLLMLLEQQRVNSNLPPFNLSAVGGAGSSGHGAGSSGHSGQWCAPPSLPQGLDAGGGSKGGSLKGGSVGGGSVGGGSVDGDADSESGKSYGAGSTSGRAGGPGD